MFFLCMTLQYALLVLLVTMLVTTITSLYDLTIYIVIHFIIIALSLIVKLNYEWASMDMQ